MHSESDEQFAHELADCEACMLQAEREIALLGWLPTSAVCTIIERVGRERARQHDQGGQLVRRLCHAAGLVAQSAFQVVTSARNGTAVAARVYVGQQFFFEPPGAKSDAAACSF